MGFVAFYDTEQIGIDSGFSSGPNIWFNLDRDVVDVEVGGEHFTTLDASEVDRMS